MTMSETASANRMHVRTENLGLLLGLAAVSAFALTLPITRYLTQYLSVWEIGLGRSLLAAIAAAGILVATRQKLPNRQQLLRLCVTASGIAFGFPILTAVGMQTVPASHGGIVLGSLPLATALIGCFLSGERPSLPFWLVAAAGFALVTAFSLLDHGGSLDLSFYTGDLALLGAVALAGLGYAQGGMLARSLGGWQVICWTLVVALPLLVPLTFTMTDFSGFSGLPGTGWAAFAFLALVNSLIGFFWWYKGLAIGGIARVSQVQLLQPFLTFFFAVVFLGEHLSWIALAFTAATVAVVMVSKRMPVKR